MADDHGRFEDQLGGLIRQSKGRNDGLWEGTMTEYMALVHANPKITQLAPARIYELIMSRGTERVGGVASGKSTIASLLRRGLEQQEPPLYAIRDCPLHEEPLHLVPRSKRPEFERLLGARIEGDLCPVCHYRPTEAERYTD